MLTIFSKATGKMKSPMGRLLLLFLGLLIIFVGLIKLMGGDHTAQVAQQMQAVKPDEPVQNNIRYTTQETLNTLTGETDNLTKSVSELQQQFNTIKEAAQKNQQSMQDTVKQEIDELDKENTQLRNKMFDSIKQLTKRSHSKSSTGEYEINGAVSSNDCRSDDFVWVDDTSASTTVSHNNHEDQYDVDVSASNDTGSLLHPQVDSGAVPKLPASQLPLDTGDQDAPKPTPYYTIPPDSWATGIILEQPLIGVIPDDRSVLNPQTVTFAIGKKNLAANHWRLPTAISGMQGTAVCQGVFVTFSQSYVQCDVNNLTFIFHDGRITTVKGTKDAPLGQITNRYGSSYIPGKYHGNVAFAATGTGFFSGLQGFGNAFAASQQSVSQGASSNIYQIKNTLNYGAGSAVGAMGEAWNDWWHDLLKSTTNFVYAPNWDPKTRRLKLFNIKIMRSIPIDYDPNGRKVNYENQMGKDENTQLD